MSLTPEQVQDMMESAVACIKRPSVPISPGGLFLLCADWLQQNQALTEALKDSARLDWLQSHSLGAGWLITFPKDHQDIRTAIDRAMQAEKEPK
jgi:hypothetical protein